MEGDLEESTTPQTTGDDQETGDDESCNPHVHYSTEPDQVLLFDSWTSSTGANQNDDMERVQEKLMTHHVQSSQSNKSFARARGMSSDF